MSLNDKYAKLLAYLQSSHIENFSVAEQNSVLYVSGSTNSATKDLAWKIYNEIDPDMRGGDLVLNLEIVAGSEEIYVIQKNDNLSTIAQKYPGMTWQKIFEANKDTIQSPDKIFPGQEIKIPL